jgi:hypothetical protein
MILQYKVTMKCGAAVVKNPLMMGGPARQFPGCGKKKSHFSIGKMKKPIFDYGMQGHTEHLNTR